MYLYQLQIVTGQMIGKLQVLKDLVKGKPFFIANHNFLVLPKNLLIPLINCGFNVA